MFSINLFLRFPKRFKIGLFKRNTSSKSVRVRFAPSPTGQLHLGGLRTALYNHLFAKSQNGVTILRIEDTDLARKVDNATEELIEDLTWSGITYDEGPYFQSERIEIYQKYAQQLLEQKDAYYCFCTANRLNLMRREAAKAGQITKYDNCCRNLTKEEVEEKMKSGITPCVRFKLSNFEEGFEDLIHGRFCVDIAAVEGDPVILKADGFPTYHFANVIDDHLMNITHVLRGVEWQVSTPKHLLLYKAFKWDPPLFGHLPLLLNADGTKISKRQGDARIQDLRNNGIFPNAVINFLIRFGGGFSIEQKDKDLKIFTMDELIEKFDVSKIKSSSCKILLHDINDCNQMEIKRLLETKDGTDVLVKRTQQIVLEHFKNSESVYNLTTDYEQIKLVLHRMKDRISKLEDLVTNNFRFLWVWSNKGSDIDEEIRMAIQKFLPDIAEIEWDPEVLNKLLKDFCKTENVKFPLFMKALREILSNQEDGPKVAEIMELLGKDRVLFRLTSILDPKR